MNFDYHEFNHLLAHHGTFEKSFRTKNETQKYIDNCPFELENYKIINPTKLNRLYHIELDYDCNQDEYDKWVRMKPKKKTK